MASRFTYAKYQRREVAPYRLRITSRDIGYFVSVIESYDGLGLVRTIDDRLGIVEAWVTAERTGEFEELLRNLGRELSIEVITRP